MSHIEDFKINYKLLANNQELVLDEEGKLAIKNQNNNTLSSIDKFKSLSSFTSDKNEQPQLQQQQNKNKKKQKQQEKKDRNTST